MSKGYIHIYTGNGKGKTTAALGLALRAVGAGKRVFVAQFVKGMKYSEVDIINNRFDEIEIRQYGLDCFIFNAPTDADIEAAREGLNEVKSILCNPSYDLVILDEANIALYYNLFGVNELIDALRSRNDNMEVVITGRYAPEKLIEYADLVTEMKEVKHYYNNGVEARKGIEF